MYANTDECDAAKLDIKKVESIARRLSSAAKEADALGMHIFGGAGSGTLRFDDGEGCMGAQSLIIADLDGRFDGGDGAEEPDEGGLIRGE